MTAAAAHRRRRVLRAGSTILIAAGFLILVDAGLTLFWQEPVTAFITARTQSGLRGDLRRLSSAPLTPAERSALSQLANSRQRIAFMAGEFAQESSNGQALGRIVITRIGADFVVVKGSDAADLRKGPGVYDGSPLPGTPGTVAIAGHRTTYLAPFRHIDDLRPGDRVTLRMPYASFTYNVLKTKIVAPTDVAVIRRVRFDQLVLTACHPLFSASKRIVVFARLVSERAAPVVAEPQLVPSVS